ncbi:MAG TPA: LytTR family DNA-binding domain-containing protein [Usitatibacter sp.]|nr:LytTR family DNA-binding domain-containing protein [Usitatibacter sp.]
MPTAIIAEDEPILREQLKAKLAKLWPELEILAAVGDGAAALEALEERAPDFMFLDIRMPEATGLEVARVVGGRAHVVFVTAYDEYAIQAFEAGAVDYLLKPATDERLGVAIERLKSKLATAPRDLTAVLSRLAEKLEPGRERLKWIKATVGQNLRLIPVSEVLYFQSDEKYTRVVTAEGEALIKTPIRELLAGLDPDAFWQIHRSTVVNAGAIAGVTRDFRGQAHLKVRGRDESLVVSRIYSHLFKQM